MSRESVKCSVCGGVMRMVAQVATKLGPSRRYKCTCGHSEDLKEDHPILAKSDELFDLEGFQEIQE